MTEGYEAESQCLGPIKEILTENYPIWDEDERVPSMDGQLRHVKSSSTFKEGLPLVGSIGKRILVRPISKKKERRIGMLLLPGMEDSNVTCLIIASGDEVDPQIDNYEYCIIPPDCGVPVEIGGVTYLSIVDNQVLALTKEVEDGTSDSAEAPETA